MTGHPLVFVVSAFVTHRVQGFRAFSQQSTGEEPGQRVLFNSCLFSFSV